MGKVKEDQKEKEKIRGKNILTQDTDSKIEGCLACEYVYRNPEEEEWVVCFICKTWAHVKCVTGNTL